MKRCPSCGETKPLENFTKTYCKPCNALRYKEYKARNKGKEAARRKAYKEKNKDKVAAYHKAYNEQYRKGRPHWRHRYPEVAKAQEVRRRGYRAPETFPARALSAKLAYWGGKCWICLEAPHEHWDHVKPLSKGGLHLLSNLRPSCASCNLSKGNQWPYVPPRLRSLSLSA